MIADLKAKAEGFDKKRIYTAVSALVIAGAAGHIMQRGANGSSGDQVLSASVPPAAQVAAPAVVAAGMAGAPKVFAPTPAARAVEPEPVAEAGPVAEEQVTTPAAPERLAEVEFAPEGAPTPETVENISEDSIPDVATAPKAMELADAVTRSDTDPILALSEVAPTPSAEPFVEGEEVALTDPEMAPVADEIKLASAETTTDPGAEPAPAAPNCEIAFDATAQPGALVLLTLSAPCNAAEEVEFEHAGLKFSEQLGPEGDLYLLVPAMTEPANFTVQFPGMQEKAAEVTLPDFAAFERVAVMWKGATGLQLHALENGASYGEPGHVWAEAPADSEAALSGMGGFISVLGSIADGYAADVYTYPVAAETEPQVSIEAQVMENTCGGEISGEILRSNAGRAPTMEHLSMAVPGCDAVGEYLVLNNLPQDLKLARN